MIIQFIWPDGTPEEWGSNAVPQRGDLVSLQAKDGVMCGMFVAAVEHGYRRGEGPHVTVILQRDPIAT